MRDTETGKSLGGVEVWIVPAGPIALGAIREACRDDSPQRLALDKKGKAYADSAAGYRARAERVQREGGSLLLRNSLLDSSAIMDQRRTEANRFIVNSDSIALSNISEDVVARATLSRKGEFAVPMRLKHGQYFFAIMTQPIRWSIVDVGFQSRIELQIHRSPLTCDMRQVR